MSIRMVVTGGFGNGTFSGAVKEIVTSGFLPGEESVTPEAEVTVKGGAHPYHWREEKARWEEYWRRRRGDVPVIEEIPETAELAVLEKIKFEDMVDEAARQIQAAEREQRRVELIALINERLDDLEMREIMAMILRAAV